MDNRIPQYQRAVTPTIVDSNASPSMVKGKVLSYNSNLIRGNRPSPLISDKVPQSSIAMLSPSSTAATRQTGMISPRSGNMTDGTITSTRGIAKQSATGASSSGRSLLSSENNAANVGANAESNSGTGHAMSVLPRHDLIPLNAEVPNDGIIFAKTKTVPEVMVVFRTPEERLRNPERLNLDRRQLEVCPLLEQEQRLRLLNFQNNNVKVIQNLENLPNLIFLDLYNNKITSLEGSLSSVKGLRVLMAGKNKISAISNLQHLRKLDVLDLHSNEIRVIEGLNGLSDLRVLNLAGMFLSQFLIFQVDKWITFFAVLLFSRK
jgi:Leucine-rich repeat (LRR) protein